MPNDPLGNDIPSFLGTGWSFPPRFAKGAVPSDPDAPAGFVEMTTGVEDIEASLRILFRTTVGERFLVPTYGLDLHEMLFDSVSTTTTTYLEERIKTAILIHEPRIALLSLRIDTSRQPEGLLRIVLDYAVRATNSRYNLVFPFFTSDSNEWRDALGMGASASRAGLTTGMGSV
jgi:phage baseplate assembly protein W